MAESCVLYQTLRRSKEVDYLLKKIIQPTNRPCCRFDEKASLVSRKSKRSKIFSEVLSFASLIGADTVSGLVSLCSNVKHFCSRSFLVSLSAQPSPHETPPRFNLCLCVFITSSVGSSCPESTLLSSLNFFPPYCLFTLKKPKLLCISFSASTELVFMIAASHRCARQFHLVKC